MLYPENVICNEIRWEYGLPKYKAMDLIDQYKFRGEYGLLCRLIENRKSLMEGLKNGSIY